MSYTVNLVIHVDDYHARPTPKVVGTLDEVTALVEHVQDTWSDSPNVTVRTKQDGDVITITVEN